MEKKAALYLRVSTTRQAEKDLSIPDQRRQAEAYCQRKGWKVACEFVEPGASATDDKRPAFQKMVEEASVRPATFDVIIVHSFSRFFRDAYQFEFYRRKLAKQGVEVISITQELGTDPMGDMVRQILNLFDEYQSKETAKHVLRAMKENTRQGFWNGAQPPYGYKAVAVDVRSDVIKKRLAIEPTEAEVVKQIFDHYQHGKGVRVIVDILNGKGLRTRSGKLFHSSLVHKILTNTACKGIHHFNKRNHKTRTLKPVEEWVPLETPIIIEPQVFDVVQQMLANHRPSVTPPRIVNGPTLLTGLAKCASCGGGMTLRTGKSGRYRYYTCNSRSTKGPQGCGGRSVPMEKLDELILSELEQTFFQRDRIKVIINELVRRRSGKADDGHLEEKRLRSELRAVELKIDRLMDAVADGLVGNSDSFKAKLASFEQQRDELIRQTSVRKRSDNLPAVPLSDKNIDRFTKSVRLKLRDRDSNFRKRYLNLFVDRIEVDDTEVRIFGSKSALAAAISKVEQSDTAKVPAFVREWWARQDSNLQPDRYERPALTS